MGDDRLEHVPKFIFNGFKMSRFEDRMMLINRYHGSMNIGASSRTPSDSVI